MTQRVSKASLAWAEKVYARRPVSVSFVRIPASCAKSGCQGYHEGVLLEVDESGDVFKTVVTSFHAVVTEQRRCYVGRGVEPIARVGYTLLSWVRRVDPWARYPEMGYRDTLEGYEEVWF